MALPSATQGAFTLKAYPGDFKTLLAFNFSSQADAANLAGFTIRCQPPGEAAYYLLNDLQFENPAQHAQVSTERPDSSINAPFQKYRWVHVPGTSHQGLAPAAGSYTYTVTPRFFGPNQNMLPLEASRSASVNVAVGPFRQGALSLGFTRGYMQSQAYGSHFGEKTPVVPRNHPLQFDTSEAAGTNSAGQQITFAQIYQWMGSTARVQVFDVLDQVLTDASLSLAVFAYDLDEPDILDALLKLAGEGRVRVILDNASLHTNKAGTTPEDQFTALFEQQRTGNAAILRGHFARYSHDKIFIVSKNGKPLRVLTGSTNFSLTGLYVNANHVLVFDEPAVANEYLQVFEESWTVLSAANANKTSGSAFAASPLAGAPYPAKVSGVGAIAINFSPHTTAYVSSLLGGLVDRIDGEVGKPKGNVLFAVMELNDTQSKNPVYTALDNIYKQGSVFSYGISDDPDGIVLYQPATPQGVLVTGKPGKTLLPPPFNQVPSPPGHEIHDKFVVCGLNGDDPVVYCGSSNLAAGGEHENGDNLLEIHDAGVATAFAIEALLLIDHYNFLDRFAQAKAAKKPPVKKTPPAKKAARGTVGKSAKKAAPAKKAPARKAAARQPAARRSR